MRFGLALAVCAVLATGCKVQETRDEEGDEALRLAPAEVEVGTDTATVRVPDVDIDDDTAATTTTY